MFRAAVLVAVVVIVPEVEWFVWSDELTAAPADEGAGCVFWDECFAECSVCVVVSAFFACASCFVSFASMRETHALVCHGRTTGTRTYLLSARHPSILVFGSSVPSLWAWVVVYVVYVTLPRLLLLEPTRYMLLVHGRLASVATRSGCQHG